MTVVDRIREREGEHAGRPAVIEAGRIWTHAELFDRVDRLSQALRGLGVEKGTAVLAWLPNAHEAVETELATFQLGGLWVTLNARLTWAEVAGAIASTLPRVVVTAPECLARVDLDVARPELPGVIVTGGDGGALGCGAGGAGGAASALAGATLLSYEALLCSSPARRPDVALGPEDVARLRYTSGTTGEAKAAVLPHRVYDAQLERLLGELHPLGPDDRVLHVAPVTHASGALLHPVLAAGGAHVLHPRFDAEAALDAIERERVTAMFVVPTILGRLAAAASFGRRDFGSLRTLFYGGAPMPESGLVRAIDRLGHALVQIYGMTEAPWPVTTLRQAEHYRGGPRLGSIGRPVAPGTVRVVKKDGADAAPGETGEIRIAGPNVMRGYWKDEEATRRVLQGGWLASGDLARADADGFLRIVGRAKDVIISGGFNVYAQELEETLATYEGVLEAAVVGLPDVDLGERVAVFLVAKPGAAIDADALRAWCRRRMSGYKCPREVRIVSELPRTASGKIKKGELGRK